MPADSEPRDPGGPRQPRRPVTAPDLPHTWRPFGVRIAVWGLGVLLVVLIAFVWVGLGAEIRSQFTPFQRGTLVLMVLLLLMTYHALVRSRVTATNESLVVVNGYRKRVFEWSQVIAVSLRSGAPWGTLDLSDGTTVSLIGIQGSDGQRAKRAVRELRAVLAARSLG